MNLYQKKRKHKIHTKSAVFVTCLLLVLLLTSGITLAYLVTKTDPVTNTFHPSKVTTEIDEEFDGETKKNVKIKNTGDVEAWIRASIVITWQDKDGNVYGKAPVEGTDYTITYNLSADGWQKGDDGYFYWSKPVAPSEPTSPLDNSNLTGVLINECKETAGQAPEGYRLTVEIIGSGIQSKPDSVFDEMWKSSGLKVGTMGLEKASTSEAGGNNG